MTAGQSWDDYQKCPVCFAELGKPWAAMAGVGPESPVFVPADVPHRARKLRAAAERGEASRG